MDNTRSSAHQFFIGTGALLSWFALIFQLYLILLNRSASVVMTLIEFFSYFTILTNGIIAIAFMILLMKDSPLKRFFGKPKTLTAIAVYICVVGLVYNLVLRQLWQPQGLQRIVDELLHLINPVFFLVYWLIFVPKKELNWKNPFPWLLYPLLYTIYILIRGLLTDLYPYPFMDINKLGYNAVLLNSVGVLAAFLFFSFLFVGVGKIQSRR